MGCVPKKVMWNTASIAEALHDAKDYGFGVDAGAVKFDWATIKTSRDAYVKRLNVRSRNRGGESVWRRKYCSAHPSGSFCGLREASAPFIAFS